MTEPTNIYESIDQMIALCEKKVALLRDLKKALLLAELVGIPPKDIKGKLSSGVYTPGTSFRPWRTDEFVIRLDGEEVYRKKLIDVPLDLWPADVRAEYERQQKRNIRKAHA